LKIFCDFPEFIEPFYSSGVNIIKIKKEIIFSPPLKCFGGGIEGIGAAADFLVIFRKFMEPFCSNGVDKNRKNSGFSPPFDVGKRQRRGTLALPLIFL